MPRTPKDVTEAELAVLQVLWSAGPSTIQSISEKLYPQDAVKKYSTVKRLLARLEEKGYVRREPKESLLTFVAARSREDLVGARLENLVQTLCEGSISPLLSHLSNARGLSAAQQESLRKLIDDLKRSPRRRSGRGKPP